MVTEGDWLVTTFLPGHPSSDRDRDKPIAARPTPPAPLPPPPPPPPSAPPPPPSSAESELPPQLRSLSNSSEDSGSGSGSWAQVVAPDDDPQEESSSFIHLSEGSVIDVPKTAKDANASINPSPALPTEKNLLVSISLPLVFIYHYSSFVLC